MECYGGQENRTRKDNGFSHPGVTSGLQEAASLESVSRSGIWRDLQQVTGWEMVASKVNLFIWEV